MFIAAAGTLGQRRAAGATIAASGTTRGPGSIHRLAHPSFEGLGSSTVALVSTAVLAIIVFGAGQSVAIALLWGLFDTSWHSRAFWFGAGSLDEPSNTALQPSIGAVASGWIAGLFKRRSRLSARPLASESRAQD